MLNAVELSSLRQHSQRYRRLSGLFSLSMTSQEQKQATQDPVSAPEDNISHNSCEYANAVKSVDKLLMNNERRRQASLCPLVSRWRKGKNKMYKWSNTPQIVREKAEMHFWRQETLALAISQKQKFAFKIHNRY